MLTVVTSKKNIGLFDLLHIAGYNYLGVLFLLNGQKQKRKRRQLLL